MRLSRRQWLSIAISGLGVSGRPFPRMLWAQSVSPDLEQRVARIILEYEEQGDHRTGSVVDGLSADWLSAQVRLAGAEPTLESFAIQRIDPVTGALVLGGRRIDGMPLFDAAFTDADGVRGRFGPLESDAEIGLTDVVPNTAASGALGEARRTNRHRALVCVTRGGRPGLCPSNADFFRQPYGPPVLQVSSTEGDWLTGHARQGSAGQVIAHVARTPCVAINVTARIAGTDPALPPLVVMTPRSGWYRCASERGGGIACWLEVMRALRSMRQQRDVLFVASTGHELGHLGIDAYIDLRPGIVPRAAGWMHFGACIGAAIEPTLRLQASDDHFDDLLSTEIVRAGLRVDQRIARGTVPGGEAEAVHRGGGRYVSMVGRSALFHNAEDRGPDVVAPATIAKYCAAFTAFAARLAGA